ncbi:MAG: DNA alkylation repair protein [Terriglobia bacterium]
MTAQNAVTMKCAEILRRLASRPDPHAVEGMARFGIVAKKVYGGWSTPELKKLAREIGRDHALAQELWASEAYEARALATMIDDPERITEGQMNKWARDFDSWAICDGACINLFRYTRFAHQKCVQWSARREEFVKRATFSLMAGLAVADKAASDDAFLRFLPLIERAAVDERNMVRKGVNWALRQIGKRNARLNRATLAACREIHRLDSRAARWIASDARRELQSPAVQARLKMVKAAAPNPD